MIGRQELGVGIKPCQINLAMRNERVVTVEKVELKGELIGGWYGQTDHQLRAFVDGEVIGTLTYSVYNDEPSVNFIEVDLAQRRKGIGSLLLKTLQAQFPDVQIHLGDVASPEGRCLINSLKFKVVETEYMEVARELEQVRATLKDYSERCASGMLTEDERAGWNDLHDRRDDLEKVLCMNEVTKRLICIDGDDQELLRGVISRKIVSNVGEVLKIEEVSERKDLTIGAMRMNA